ncbi:hypothetical protein [Iodobacter fluviatilis]|uniref:Uncharacterized protein n=1 Tax=Iodobacter fluviatilis TaxID=537 RepID=A0A377Q8U0_9NEIS|nr:hypothetical protein [Iodobacter fluviatilis]TCU88800.1 hypothetical protein EV682_103384 [Iodobacter fluviatilis]STQ91128.1 Uncharacterised protein [Iodobacter fluviatilis]
MEKVSKYALHEYSEYAIKRSSIFVSTVENDGFEVLPGRYGGEYNNDMLAIGKSKEQDKDILLLGLKVTGDDGDLQLDMKSLGSHRQLSSEWLDVVVYSLRLSEQGCHFAERIAAALAADRLVTGVVYLDGEDEKVKLIRISQDVDD